MQRSQQRFHDPSLLEDLHSCRSRQRPFASANASYQRCRQAYSSKRFCAHVEHITAPQSTRREILIRQATAAALVLASCPSAEAIGFQKELKRKKIPLEEYATLEDGIKYYDTSSGSGDMAVPGKTISVHFDVTYRTLDVVSTRSARLLGGNRSVAEPFEFVVGQPVSQVGVKKINDSANGLFSGQSGVKPPPALSTAVIGMKLGGKRIVNVPPEIGYGDQGIGEIPPGATVQLQVELLKVLK